MLWSSHNSHLIVIKRSCEGNELFQTCLKAAPGWAAYGPIVSCVCLYVFNVGTHMFITVFVLSNIVPKHYQKSTHAKRSESKIILN